MECDCDESSPTTDKVHCPGLVGQEVEVAVPDKVRIEALPFQDTKSSLGRPTPFHSRVHWSVGKVRWRVVVGNRNSSLERVSLHRERISVKYVSSSIVRHGVFRLLTSSVVDPGL